MKNSSFLYTFLMLVLLFLGCAKSTLPTLESDRKQLNAMLQDIENITNKVICENEGDWKFAPIGAKACGGPSHYIAYPKKIDENAFLTKVTTYTNKEKAFNEKWGIISTCDIARKPAGVTCIDGKPKLLY